jgi:hypothetical protein
VPITQAWRSDQMEDEALTEERQLKEYIAGDVVRVHLDITHEMHLEEAVAYYHQAEDPSVHIILEAEDWDTQEYVGGGRKQHTMWTLAGEVQAKHLPGVYKLERFALITAADRTHILRTGEHLTQYDEGQFDFRIVEEPSEPPKAWHVVLLAQ